MAIQKMSLYDALLQKKLYEKKIGKIGSDLGSIKYFGYKNELSKVIEGIEVDNIPSLIQSNFQKHQALFKNLAAIRVAIFKANNETKVTIAGVEYTLATALARYQNIAHEREFVRLVLNDYRSLLNRINSENRKITDRDRVLAEVLQTIKKDGSEEISNVNINELVEEQINKLTIHLIDTNNIVEKNWIENTMDEIDEFENRFHSAINKVNHETEIEFETVD